MRIIKQYDHPILLAELFTYAEKYTLKIKFRGLEQSYPVPADQLQEMEGVLNRSDHPFYREVLNSFHGMQKNLLNHLLPETRGENPGEEEEII